MTPFESNQEISVTVLNEAENQQKSQAITNVNTHNENIDLNEGTFGYLIVKRTMDIIFSILGLLLLIPIFCVIGILIKKEDSSGSIFFKQERVGKNGKKFNMYKFRSMVSNAEDMLDDLLHLNEVSGAMFKMKSDPRITKIGKIIRSTSIDELPQLWNVLKGDMSLVGPRPPLDREVVTYTPYEKRRLIVKPGCTGLWQATVRNEVGFKEMVELDLTYIKKKSILFDIKLIYITVISLIFKTSY